MSSGGLVPVPVSSQKHDPAWKHVQIFMDVDKMQLKCIYCEKLFKGGGIHRIKEHLAGQKGNASTCHKTPSHVRAIMQESLDGVVFRKKKKQKIDEDVNNVGHSPSNIVDSFVVQPITMAQLPETSEPSSNLLLIQEDVSGKKNVDKRKRGRPKLAIPISNIVTVYNGTDLVSEGANNQVHMAIGRFLYDVGLPLDAINSGFFKPMVDAMASKGAGIVPPSYHDLRGWILKHSLDEVKTDVNRYIETWGRTSCSLLVDQWSTEKGKTLINFLVHCSEGTVFLKSVDVSEISHSTEALCVLLKDMIEEVGPAHILQIITNGEEQYVTAAKRLANVFPSLFWSTCASHCIDLMLEDFGKLDWINEVIEQARSITKFVYNNSVVLNMMKRFTFGNDIVVPGVSRFDTNFVTLKRMVDLKNNLQSMVTSQEWMDTPYSKKRGGLQMLDFISNQSFWASCILIVHLTEPLLRVSKIVGCVKKPGMAYVYAGMYRAIETIKKQLVKKDEYMVYWNLIDHLWEQCPLHAAAFYLNPKFLYSMEGDIPNHIVSGMFDCIERLVPDIDIQDKIIKELNVYKNSVGDFGRKMAIRARETMRPDEWWSTYGGGCPNLARLAIRILSQTCSSIGFKRDQIPFEQLHITRNCLEHQRLTDLIFVQYNLRLKMAKHSNGHDSTDPISFERTRVVEEWITDKDVCLDDYGSSDWFSLDPPSGNTMLLGVSNDDVEELGTGFDDYEIFNRVKDGEE